MQERRSFLGVVIALIGSSVMAILGVITGRYALNQASEAKAADPWIDLGLLEEVTDGIPIKRTVYVTQASGWANFNTPQVVWIMRKGEKLQVFSAVCPHLGCSVNASAAGFACPCHGSGWNLEGERLTGPTPRGLDTLEPRVVEGRIQIKFRRFKQGIATKEEIV
jgi:Rieske Fe-S protein